MALGRYPISWARAVTRRRVRGLTPYLPLRARETAAQEMPARAAMSLTAGITQGDGKQAGD